MHISGVVQPPPELVTPAPLGSSWGRSECSLGQVHCPLGRSLNKVRGDVSWKCLFLSIDYKEESGMTDSAGVFYGVYRGLDEIPE